MDFDSISIKILIPLRQTPKKIFRKNSSSPPPLQGTKTTEPKKHKHWWKLRYPTIQIYLSKSANKVYIYVPLIVEYILSSRGGH